MVTGQHDTFCKGVVTPFCFNMHLFGFMSEMSIYMHEYVLNNKKVIIYISSDGIICLISKITT